jgi:DNA polymerase bacteriophage-type
MAIQAVLNPGVSFSYRSITYFVNKGILYCQLPSGRHIVYHKPELWPSEKRPGTYSLTFETWNTNPKYGAIGWVRLSTYSGKLTENVVQACARDILAHAIVNLERAGYPVVLHVHDEIVVEIPENIGSVTEVERIMSTMPMWAQGWPVVARGGWRAKRYSK